MPVVNFPRPNLNLGSTINGDGTYSYSNSQYYSGTG
jgi:hypothetical protein